MKRTGSEKIVLHSQLPYEQRAEELIADGAFGDNHLGREPRTHAELVVRAKQYGLDPASAHSVALHVGGYREAAGAAGFAAITQARNLAQRDFMWLPHDPSRLRGDVLACSDWRVAREIRPSLTLPVGVLRGLRFSAGLRPIDLLLFWWVVAFSVKAKHEMPLTELRRRFGMGETARVSASLLRLSDARLSLTDHSIPKRRWIEDGSVISVSVDAGIARWELPNELFAEFEVKRGGPRYAHLDLVAIRSLQTPKQELTYRVLLAAAAEAGAWRSEGGPFRWMISAGDAAKAFGTSNAKLFRREQFEPLAAALRAGEGRLQLDHLTVERDQSRRGRPAAEWVLAAEVAPARPKEERGAQNARPPARSADVVAGLRQARVDRPKVAESRIETLGTPQSSEVDTVDRLFEQLLDDPAGEEAREADRRAGLTELGLDGDDPAWAALDPYALRLALREGLNADRVETPEPARVPRKPTPEELIEAEQNLRHTSPIVPVKPLRRITAEEHELNARTETDIRAELDEEMWASDAEDRG